jgi:hypothetical protein
MEVDWAESEDNHEKNHIRERKIKSNFSSTMYLLRSLFEGLGIVARLHDKIVNEDSEIYSLHPRNYLFNG